MRKTPRNCQKRRLTYESCVVGFDKWTSPASSQLSVSKETFVASRGISHSWFLEKIILNHRHHKTVRKIEVKDSTGKCTQRCVTINSCPAIEWPITARAWRSGDIPWFVQPGHLLLINDLKLKLYFFADSNSESRIYRSSVLMQIKHGFRKAAILPNSM